MSKEELKLLIGFNHMKVVFMGSYVNGREEMERKEAVQELIEGKRKIILAGGAVRKGVIEVKGGNLREEDSTEE